MGLEVVALMALAGFQAHSQISQSEDQAKAVARQGRLEAEQKSKETRLKAARVQSSFLSSGLTLEGTPMAAIEDTFNIGIADTKQIISNANKQAKNIIKAGRNQAISTLASGFISAGGADMFGNMFGSGTTTAALPSVGAPVTAGGEAMFSQNIGGTVNF